MKQIVGPLTITACGILFALFIPGDYNGHALATIGWIVAAIAGICAVALAGFAIRQQNIDKEISSNMLSSNKTRVLMGDNRDHFHSDDSYDRT